MFIFAFLVLLTAFLPCLLAALKLDADLARLSGIYAYVGIGVIAAFILALIIFSVIRKNIKVRFSKPSFDLKLMWRETRVFLVPAFILWLFSTLIATPSAVCDNTEEIVATTLAGGDIYIRSAFTGEVMQAGLPIFDKVQVMPMFYAVLCSLTGLSFRVVSAAVAAIVFFGNLWIVHRLTLRFYPEESKKRQAFLCIYLLILISSTYLPTIGVPVTLGYAILRMGYSGWAVAYGLAVPYALCCFTDRKVLAGLISLSSLAGLLRLDRIFFLLRDFLKSAESVSLAGKLAFLWILALVVTLLLNLKNKEKTPLPVFFVPSLLIAHVFVRIAGLLKEKRERIAFYAGVLLILLACVDFRPFKDVTFEGGTEKNIRATLKYIPEGAKILSNTEYMRIVRRLDGDKRTAYSRALDNPYLAGLDFEAKPEYYWDYTIFADYYDDSVRDYAYSFIEGAYTVDKLVRKCVADGITVFVIPEAKNGEEEKAAFAKGGAELSGRAGGYCIYVSRD